MEPNNREAPESGTTGWRIRQKRKANPKYAKSQELLAEAVGVSRETINLWENNQQDPAGDNLFNLADVLGVIPAWIVYGRSIIDPTELFVVADKWEKDAETISGWDSDSPHAKVLGRCAQELKDLADTKKEEWIEPTKPEGAETADVTEEGVDEDVKGEESDSNASGPDISPGTGTD